MELMELINRQVVLDIVEKYACNTQRIYDAVKALPSVQPEIIHCWDCEHQIQYFYEDKRRKDGGYYIYGCELSDDYSHVCFDDDFCSRAERKTNVYNIK